MDPQSSIVHLTLCNPKPPSANFLSLSSILASSSPSNIHIVLGSSINRFHQQNYSVCFKNTFTNFVMTLMSSTYEVGLITYKGKLLIEEKTYTGNTLNYTMCDIRRNIKCG